MPLRMARTGDFARCRTDAILVRLSSQGKGHNRTQSGISGLSSFISRLRRGIQSVITIDQPIDQTTDQTIDQSGRSSSGFVEGDCCLLRTRRKNCPAMGKRKRASSAPRSRRRQGTRLCLCRRTRSLAQHSSSIAGRGFGTRAANDSVQTTLDQIGAPEITEEPDSLNSLWTLARPAMWAGILAACAVLAAGIWLYRKNHRFAAYASAPTASRVATRRSPDRSTPDGVRRSSHRFPIPSPCSLSPTFAETQARTISATASPSH